MKETISIVYVISFHEFGSKAYYNFSSPHAIKIDPFYIVSEHN